MTETANGPHCPTCTCAHSGQDSEASAPATPANEFHARAMSDRDFDVLTTLTQLPHINVTLRYRIAADIEEAQVTKYRAAGNTVHVTTRKAGRKEVMTWTKTSLRNYDACFLVRKSSNKVSEPASPAIVQFTPNTYNPVGDDGRDGFYCKCARTGGAIHVRARACDFYKPADIVIGPNTGALKHEGVVIDKSK